MSPSSDGQFVKQSGKTKFKADVATNTEIDATGEINRIIMVDNDVSVDTETDIVKPVDMCSVSSDTMA